MSGSVESLSSGNAFIRGDISPMPPELLRSSSVIRDPISDHLITPQNSAMVVIDYQPAQVGAMRSMDRDLLVKNIVSTVKLARLFGLPIVHSTVNVKSGRGKPTVPPLAELLGDKPPLDRTSINAWKTPLSFAP